MKHSSYETMLVCPECRSKLLSLDNRFQCSNTAGCGSLYPVYHGVPVMVGPHNSTFKQSDFDTQEPPDIFFKQYKSPFLRFLKKIRPDITLNTAGKKNYTILAKELAGKKDVRILVIGGSFDGRGIRALKDNLGADVILVESDVAHGPNTSIIFDSHQVPFSDESFDLVIVQAVLEHVLDPFTCVAEILRVLKTGGVIYAETPFMQQVHGGQYDFHRFTLLGHRRMFRHFKELDSGLVAGAGSSLAWSLRYFITSFAPNKKTDKVLSYIAPFLVFWLKYFDLLLNRNKGSYDAACGIYFRGEKQPGYTLPDSELLTQYKGFRN